MMIVRGQTPLLEGSTSVTGLDGLSAQALSDTIGAIYDCSPPSSSWF
jgi:hypothetical protein